MITFDAFITKYLGKGMDWDGRYGNQCVDVFKAYNSEVVGGPSVLGNAKDYFTKYPTGFYTKVANTPTGVPPRGAVIIWGMGIYGHIGICTEATQSKFTTFEQNWTHAGTITDGTGVTELRSHYYTNVLGWLIPKSDIISPPTEKMDYKAIFDKTGDIRGLEDRSPKPDFYAPEDEFKKAYVDPTNGISYVVVNLKVLNDTLSYLRDQSKPITTTPPNAPQTGDNFEAVTEPPVEV